MAEIFGNLTGLGWLIGMNHQFNWYMTAIICFYLVAPVLVRIAECVNTPTGQIAVLVILFLCGVPFFWKTNPYDDFTSPNCVYWNTFSKKV